MGTPIIFFSPPSNPYFVQTPCFFCLNSFYFFILAKSILRSNPMIFLLQMLLFHYYSQIHTSFKPHDFSSPNPFIYLLRPNPYFIRPSSFFCLISFISLYNPNPYFVKTPMISLPQISYFFTNTKSILRLTSIFFLPQFLLFLHTSQIHTLFKPHDFTSLLKPKPYFVRPPSFFCLISFISLYNQNPYFVETPTISLSQISYFLTNTKSILCLTPIFFFVSVPFISLYYPYPY